jgi:2'-5' RNA ligase
MTSAMTDDEFVRSFEDLILASSAFHHRDHVRLAWIYLGRHPALEALARFVEGLRKFAAFHGHPGLYHQTITWAYLFLIHERMADGPAGETWEEFAARNPDLFAWNPSVLDRYYDPETLRSDRARRVFVLPLPASPAPRA